MQFAYKECENKLEKVQYSARLYREDVSVNKVKVMQPLTGAVPTSSTGWCSALYAYYRNRAGCFSNWMFVRKVAHAANSQTDGGMIYSSW